MSIRLSRSRVRRKWWACASNKAPYVVFYWAMWFRNWFDEFELGNDVSFIRTTFCSICWHASSRLSIPAKHWWNSDARKREGNLEYSICRLLAGRNDWYELFNELKNELPYWYYYCWSYFAFKGKEGHCCRYFQEIELTLKVFLSVGIAVEIDCPFFACMGADSRLSAFMSLRTRVRLLFRLNSFWIKNLR